MRYLAFVVLFAVAISVDCTASQDFLKITRVTKLYANEESHKVFAGSTLRFEATGFANSETRNTEYCIDKSTNSVYTLKLVDSNNDSWYAGSFLELFNIYGVSLLKRFMKETTEETFQFSLLMPIVKGASWKHSSTFASNWFSTSFSDGSWEAMTTPGPSGQATGTHYFRATFGAPVAYAAYEARLNYRTGIVVYVNGGEIFRDNMAAGTVSHSDYATGAYSDNAYRGLLRNAYLLTTTNHIAVELHIASLTTPVLEFDAFLLLHLATSATGHNCYAVTQSAEVVASSGGSYGAQMVDGSKTLYFYASLASAVGTCTWSYTTTNPLFAQFNGVEYYIGTTNAYCPKDFQLSGARLPQTPVVYSQFASLTGKTSNSNTYSTYIAELANVMYNSYRFTISATASTYTYTYEGFPLVCGVAMPTSLSFPQSSFTIKVGVDYINTAPKELGVSQCTISPDPSPYGFTWTSSICQLTGMANSTVSQTYTISFNTGTSTITGQVSISASICTESIVYVLRNYPNVSPIEELYQVENMSGTYMFGEAYNSGQYLNGVAHKRYCIPAARYKLILSVYNNVRIYWYLNSYVTINIDHGAHVEPLMRVRFDQYNLMPNVYYFSSVVPIKTGTQWYYKHDYSTADWHSATTSGWAQSTSGNFGSSTSVYQVYRKTFSINSGDLSTAGAFSLRVNYQYGIIIMMNTYEVFRNNLGDGALASASVTGTYTTSIYRGISFPTTTVKIGEEAAKQYLKAGDNTIAIAIKGLSSSGWASNFDASIVIFGDTNSDRIFNYVATFSGANGGADYAWSKYYSQYTYSSACTTTNYVQIEFSDDRREWFSSASMVSFYNLPGYDIYSFKLLAKNAADSEFTVLSEQTGWKWWSKAQWKRFFFANNKSYSIYRFAEFSRGNPSACEWRLNDIVLWADKSDVTLSPLSYTATNSGFKNIEFAEMFPENSNLRSGFSISPALPAGLFIDPPSGVIMGTPTELVANTLFTVTYSSVGGSTATATFNLEIINCAGGKSLISIVIRVDTYPNEVQYNLYQGRGNTGTRIAYRTEMPSGSIYYWVDRCLESGIFTFEGIDTYGDGWTWPANWRLTIDYDWLSVAYAHIPSATKPVISTHTFSSYLPFQIETSDWKVWNKAAAPPASWHSTDSSESDWTVSKAIDIGSPAATTVYLRQKFNIPSMSDYRVLNVHARFSCGLVAYFNSRIVARFNLPAKFSHETACTELSHDTDKFSKFHAILETDGAMQDGNVMAFEVHKDAATSSAEPVVFDSSAIFGVQSDCNFVVSSYYNITGSWAETTDFSGAFDMIPLTYITMTNVANSFLSFSHENLAPVRWNAYYISTNAAFTGVGWTIDGRFDTRSEWIDTVVESSVALSNRGMTRFNDEMAMAGFSFLRFYVTVGPTSTWQVSEFATLYCHASGEVCQGDDTFPTVANGAKSPALCAAHYTGYRFRMCTSGSFGPIDSSHCVMLIPENLLYPTSTFRFVRDTASTTGKPTYDNIIMKFSLPVDQQLPFGMELNTETGEISGVPAVDQISKEYTILGDNDSGTARTDITIEVIIGTCKPDDVFKGAYVDETVSYDCANDGSYIGTRTRRCLLGEKDGVWEKAKGTCWSIIVIVILAVIVILIIIVLVFVLTRSRGKKKAGGKKVSKAAKKTNPKV